MKLKRFFSATAVVGFVIGAAQQASAVIGVRVIIENRAPQNGTYLTPVWVGFHDGTFDVYDEGAPASIELERLAEDGNTGPLSEDFEMSGSGSAQSTIRSDGGIPPLAPGETATMTFILDETDSSSHYFSYASMVIPSNDAFIGNDDPRAHRIIDTSGNFLGAFLTIRGTNVMDAGTEVNDELPEHTAFFGQQEPDSGVPEGGVVHQHPGYLPPGSGGILDDPMFENADFKEPGYEIARVTIIRSDTIVPSGEISGRWTVDASPYLIAGDVVVPRGEMLTIDPGVYVVSLCQCRLFVEGALDAVGTEEDPIVFTRDPGISGGGGIRFFHADGFSRLVHCIIEYGDNHRLAEPFNRGAGIYCESSSVHVDQSTIRHNLAEDGGGIFSDNCALIVSRSEIVQNIADDAGGGGVHIVGHREPVFVENRIADNFARYGGGITCWTADAQIIDNVIINNQCYDNYIFGPATASGGGIFLAEGADALLWRNLIVGNEARVEGNVGSLASGGGLRCFRGASPDVVNNTFANNQVSGTQYGRREGGAISTYNGYPNLVNNILWDDDPTEIAITTFAQTEGITIRYSDVEGGEEAISIEEGLVFWLEGNIDEDPLFADPMAGDYRLLEGSPCIDAGDPASPQDPDGTRRDMGAIPFRQGMFGDINGDGDVDLDDHGVLFACLAGPGVDMPPDDCAMEQFIAADLQDDGDVDVADFAMLQDAFGETEQPAEPGACCIRGLCFEASGEAACTDPGGTFQGIGTTCAQSPCDYWQYRSETYRTVELVHPGAGRAIADDMTLVGSGDRELVYFDLLVYAFDGGPFDAAAELWDGCPGEGGQPIPGTYRLWSDLPDENSSHKLRAEFDHILIPETVWMVVTFSTDEAGWFVAGLPQTGSSEDRFALDNEPWICDETLDTGSYAGLWANIRCE